MPAQMNVAAQLSCAAHILIPAAITAVLVACGGGGGTSAPTASVLDATTTTTTPSTTQATTPTTPTATASSPLVTFQAFASAGAASQAAPLSEAERTEAFTLSLKWAAETLLQAPSSLLAANVAAVPPLYFSRAQTVAAAASGATLQELRQILPSASTTGVAAALMQGTARTISAGPETLLSGAFLRAASASGYPDTWSALSVELLSANVLAFDPTLKLFISDRLNLHLAWPQVTVFDGVFQAENGVRQRTQLLRVLGNVASAEDATMHVAALALPSGQWLLRVIPKAGISTFWCRCSSGRDVCKSARHGVVRRIGQSR